MNNPLSATHTRADGKKVVIMELTISKSAYLKWLEGQLEEIETVSDLKDISYDIPDIAVKKGFDDIQEFLMDVNKGNPVYFTFFIKEVIHVDSYGADQIDIKWVD